MAFYFDDLLSAGDAEQALRYKFAPVDIRPGTARTDHTASSSSKSSQTPLRSGRARNKLVKYNARYSTPVVCAVWPCKAQPVIEPHYRFRSQSQVQIQYQHQLQYQYQAQHQQGRKGHSFLNL